MAEIVISRAWPDGESLTISVEVDASYPDAVAEAKQAAVNAYADALEITLTPAVDADDDSDVV